MRCCTPMALPASTHTRAELDAQRKMQRAKAKEREEPGAAARQVVAAPRRKPTALDGRPTV